MMFWYFVWFNLTLTPLISTVAGALLKFCLRICVSALEVDFTIKWEPKLLYVYVYWLVTIRLSLLLLVQKRFWSLLHFISIFLLFLPWLRCYCLCQFLLAFPFLLILMAFMAKFWWPYWSDRYFYLRLCDLLAFILIFQK